MSSQNTLFQEEIHHNKEVMIPFHGTFNLDKDTPNKKLLSAAGLVWDCQEECIA